MKKSGLNYLVIAALVVAAVCTSCGGRSSSDESSSGNGGGSGIGSSSESRSDNGSSGRGKNANKITMTTEQSSALFYLAGSGVATVDWGDGSEKISLTLNRRVDFSHTYPNESIRTITINGDNITELKGLSLYITSLEVSRCTELEELSCHGTFTNLDIRKNSALTYLRCQGELTSLDVSKNTALTKLIVYCELTSLDVSKNSALTDLDCNSNQLTTTALNALFTTLHSSTGEKSIGIRNNPGTTDCDRSIAERKGWSVYD